MHTQMWLSAGWLTLLLIVSVPVDRHSMPQRSPTDVVIGQSARLTPVVSLDQNTQKRLQAKPGGRCEGAAPASPLSAQACRQEALVRQKQAISVSHPHPPDRPIPLKGERQHG